MSRFWPALLLLLLIPAAGLLWIWWDGADSVDTAAINSAASGSVPPARAVWLPAIIMRSESITAVPAATRTPLPTITPLPSQTPTPTDTPSPIGPPPTQTPTPLPATDVPIADTCGPPRNWVRVTVQRGQTLYSLARSRGTSVAAVLQANCMRGTALSTGQTLYLPAQAIVVPTTVGTAVATIPAGSGQPAYFISAPAPGSRLQGQVSIVGTVDFVPAPGWFYKVEIGAGSAPAQWTTLGSLHAQPVQQAVLEELWVDAFAAGSYTLRLILVDHTGNYVGSPYEVPVVLEPGE